MAAPAELEYRFAAVLETAEDDKLYAFMETNLVPLLQHGFAGYFPLYMFLSESFPTSEFVHRHALLMARLARSAQDRHIPDRARLLAGASKLLSRNSRWALDPRRGGNEQLSFMAAANEIVVAADSVFEDIRIARITPREVIGDTNPWAFTWSRAITRIAQIRARRLQRWADLEYLRLRGLDPAPVKVYRTIPASPDRPSSGPGLDLITLARRRAARGGPK